MIYESAPRINMIFIVSESDYFQDEFFQNKKAFLKKENAEEYIKSKQDEIKKNNLLAKKCQDCIASSTCKRIKKLEHREYTIEKLEVGDGHEYQYDY